MTVSPLDATSELPIKLQTDLAAYMAIENLDGSLSDATELLDVAIELFLAKRSYVSVVTLAGAAEERFGSARPQGIKTALDAEFDVIDATEQIYSIHEIYDMSQDKDKRRKVFAAYKRRVLNLAKHGPERRSGKGRGPRWNAPIEIEEEALWTIVRAAENARLIGLPASENVTRFDKWFDREVVGEDNDY